MQEQEKDIRVCKYCGKKVERKNMLFTHDCYGIPFRLVCFECHEKLMEKGYDGERYYDGIDERVEPDY